MKIELRKNTSSIFFFRSAVERQVEIIGEAARGLSKGFKASHPHIPFDAIMSQRHRLAHEYGQINNRIIWTVATVHVPALIKQLLPVIEPSHPDE